MADLVIFWLGGRKMMMIRLEWTWFCLVAVLSALNWKSPAFLWIKLNNILSTGLNWMRKFIGAVKGIGNYQFILLAALSILLRYSLWLVSKFKSIHHISSRPYFFFFLSIIIFLMKVSAKLLFFNYFNMWVFLLKFELIFKKFKNLLILKYFIVNKISYLKSWYIVN